MNYSYLLIVIFVATLVGNTKSRPQDERVTNYFREYEPPKDPDQANASRYGKITFTLKGGREWTESIREDRKYRKKRDTDPVTFVRIDIPYNKTRNGVLRSIGETNPIDNDGENDREDEIQYVPVSISTKTDSIKKWPSGQNGLETLDDLHLYNTYTSSVNDKFRPPGHPDHVVPYLSHKKPAIIIIEELTTSRPYQEKPLHPTNTYTYTPIEVITYRPEPTRPSYFGTSYPTTIRPVYPSVIHPPTIPPYAPTKRPEQTKCPSVTITATNTVINNNKEGCNDIKIHIESAVHNGNNQAAGSVGTQDDPITVTPVISITEKPDEDMPQIFGLGIGDLFSSVFTTFSGLTLFNPLSLTFWSTLFSPLLILIAGGVGAAALILPCAIFSGRNQGRNRYVILRDRLDKPKKYEYGVSLDGSKQFLKRTTRSILSLPYRGHIRSAKGRRKYCLTYCLTRKGRGLGSNNCSNCRFYRVNALSSCPPWWMTDVTYGEATSTQTDLPRVENAGRIAQDIEAIAVVARATSDRPVMGRVPEVVAQMAEGDIRTPPKLKEIIQGKISNDGKRRADSETTTESDMVVDRIEANGRFELPGERASSLPYVISEGKPTHTKRKDEDLGVKGIAVPVLMDDSEPDSTPPPKKLQKIPEVIKPVKEEKKKTNAKPAQNPTTTPSSGLSTWILLSDNRDSTTSSPKKNNKKDAPPKSEDKKTIATTKKTVKVQTTTTTTTTMKPATMKPTLVTKKGVITPKPEIRKNGNETESMSALEAMVKNQKKQTTKVEEAHVTRLPAQKKPTTVKPNRINDRMDVAENKYKPGAEVGESKRPSTIPPMLPIATQNPTTVALSDQQGTGQTTTDPSVETTTKKKKSGSKKKKKNKNRRRKPSNDTQIEQKNVSKNPQQPVGAQFYNFLSREIMPTVGLGLVGVLVTAGLAGLLGYNPFVSANLPVRRTYEIQHGYSPNNYYNYNNDYSEGGQSEEALFREVLSGMPEGSRYGLSNAENSYPESQIYSSQDQVYDAMKSQTDKKFQNTQYQYPESKTEDETSNYDGTYPQGYTSSYAYDSQDVLKNRDNSDKYPTYDREVSASYVYPEGTSPEKSSRLNEEYENLGKHSDASVRYGTDKISSKYSNTKEDTIERQPEALYRVAGDYDHSYRGESTIQGISSQNSWHRIGSAMDYTRYSHLEPGPRSLNFTKEEMLTSQVAKKRTKRAAESVIQRIGRKQVNVSADKDIENEIDFEEPLDRFPEVTTEKSTVAPQTEDVTNVTTEADYDVIETHPITYNILDVLKRLAQFKLKIGLSFLKSTTDAFSRYLDVIQKRVDDSITNTTMVYRIRRNPSRSRRSTENKRYDKKRSSYKNKSERKKSWKKN